MDRRLGGPAIEVVGVDPRVAGGTVDRLGLVEELAGEVADAQAPQQGALGLGRVQPRGQDGAAGGDRGGHAGAHRGVDRHAVVPRDRGEGLRLLLRREAALGVLVGALGPPTSRTFHSSRSP
jgi:hypothetical protein